MQEVTNQPPPLVDYNVFEADRPLVEAVEREAADWASERLRTIGALAGSAEIRRKAVEANEKSILLALEALRLQIEPMTPNNRP